MKIFIKIALISLLALVGCGGGGGSSSVSGNVGNVSFSASSTSRKIATSVRLIHAALDVPPLAIRSAEDTIQVARYAEVTPFIQTGSGPIELRLEREIAPSAPVLGFSTDLQSRTQYTIFTFGRFERGSLNAALLEDNLESPPEGTTLFQVLHAMDDTGSFNILIDGVPTLNGVFGTSSGYAEIVSGVHTVTIPGAPVPPLVIDFTSGSKLTLLVTGSPSRGTFVPIYPDVTAKRSKKQENKEVVLLEDRSGNGLVEVAAFGDSIVRGQGDFGSLSIPGGEAGYPLRVETYLGIPVYNLGDPGERLIREGLPRFVGQIPAIRPDVVVISGGANDGIDGRPRHQFFRGVQMMVNVAKANNVEVVLATTPLPCCNRDSLRFPIEAYNQEMQALAFYNKAPLADASRGFMSICGSHNCYLQTRPNGLHPNSEGYDVFGEAVISALLGIDLFTPDGPAELEQALNLPEGSVKTRPPAPPPIEEPLEDATA